MEDQHIPLVADLDGTLLKTDSLWEGAAALLAHDPLAIFRMPFWILEGKTAFKNRLAAWSAAEVEALPVNEVVFETLRAALLEGRKVYLATAACRPVAEAVAARFGIFSGVFASDDGRNLNGEAKAQALAQSFGEKAFDYIGDSRVDAPVWKRARTALVASGDEGVKNAARAANAKLCFLPVQPPRLKDFSGLFRVRQWIKNLLIFLPLLLAHVFTLEAATLSALAFFSFSCCASAIYIVNDLLDISSDRKHPSKKHRAFASGSVPLRLAPACFALAVLCALVPCCFLPLNFALCLSSYFFLTISYSCYFKKRLMLDVVILASLYVIRIIAGAAAIGIGLSNWLLAFGIFIFTGLALLKRIGDLAQHKDDGALPGRAYLPEDKAILEGMAVCSGLSSIVVATLYIDSLQAAQLYAKPDFLWGFCPLMLYWYGRMLIIAHRGELGDDPVQFTLEDKPGRYCLLAGVVLLLLAI